MPQRSMERGEASAQAQQRGEMVRQLAAQATSDDEMIRLWLDSKRAATTREGYGYDIGSFRRFYRGELAELTVRRLLDYMASLDHLAPAAVCRRMATVKSLISFAHRLGYLAFDVGAPVQLPAIRDNLASRILPEFDVARLLAGEHPPREAAMLSLLYVAGLRISELCGLRWQDFIERDGAAQVTVFGKGGKSRPVLLTPSCWKRLLRIRGFAPIGAPVFPGAGGRPMNRSYAHALLKACFKRAGLPPNASAHWLRHAHASHALDRGCPVHVLQATLGHASLETTTRYVHVRPGDSSSRYLAQQ